MTDKMPPRLPEDFAEQIKKNKPKDHKPYKEAVLSEEEFIKLELPPTEWIFDRLIPKPALIALTGRPGSYKTFFAHWIARRASEGLPLFFEHDDIPEWNMEKTRKPVKTLVIEEEMGAEIMQERMNDLKQGNAKNIFWLLGMNFSLKDPSCVQELVDLVIEKGIELLILDPFSSISAMKDENDNAEAAKIMDTLLSEFVNGGPKITVIFIHHPSKSQHGGDAIRGAGDILGKSYIQYVLEKVDGYDSTRIKVRCPKHRWRQIREFEMEIIESNQPEDFKALTFVYRGNQGDVERGNQSKIAEEILASMWKPEKSYKKGEVADTMGVDKLSKEFSSAWNMLIDAKKLCPDGAYRYKKNSQ